MQGSLRPNNQDKKDESVYNMQKGNCENINNSLNQGFL